MASCSQVVAKPVDLYGVYQQGKPGTAYTLGLLDQANIGAEVKKSAGTNEIPEEQLEVVRQRAETMVGELK